jgi:cytosine/adenosine deaminase-related metal-dependent hydrolase
MRTLIRHIRRLEDPNSVADVVIDGGVIERIGTLSGDEADMVLEGDGGLALPAFVNTHVHLDKCLTGDEAPPGAFPTLEESVRQTWRVKRSYTVDGDVVVYRAPNATEVLRLMQPPAYVVPNGALAVENELRQHVAASDAH